MAVGDWLRDWWSPGAQPEPAQPGSYGTELDSPYWQHILRSTDGLSLMVAARAQPENARRMLVGGTPYGLLHTDPDTSMLVLGPPRSIGKTAGVMIPNVLLHRGPAVVVSTKPDLAVATALHQRRKGRVWQFSPDGSAPLPGFEELRWTPISNDWGGCLARAEWMVKASGMGDDNGTSNAKFFASRASSLLAITLFYAGITGKDVAWVVDVINAYDLAGDFRAVRDGLKERGHEQAARLLNGLVSGDDRTVGNVFATAASIISPYLLPGSLATTTRPNFNAEYFVNGQPWAPNDLILENPMNHDMVRADGTLQPTPWQHWAKQPGVFDTIYVVVTEENMALTAPLIIGFLGDVRRQVLKQHRADVQSGTFGRAQTLWCIDELASVPIPDLPIMLRDSGSQGLLILGALQDLSQAAKWGSDGAALITLFNNVMVLPGLRDRQSLELWSMLAGQFDQEVWAGSYSHRENWGRQDWNASQSWQRMNRLDPADIYRGNPHDKDGALVFARNSWLWCSIQLWHRSGIWPALVQVSAEFALRADHIRNQGLPYPDLVRGGNDQFLRSLSPQLARSYHDTRARYQAYHGRRQLR